jgi:hypothetical protein
MSPILQAFFTYHSWSESHMLLSRTLSNNLIKCAALVVVATLAQGCASAKPKTFASPELAVNGMVSALDPFDRSRLDAIFGSKADELTSSGDAVADQQAAARFLNDYNKKHELVANPDGSRTLQIGENDWPFPVPLVEHSGQWSFDTEAGLDEILNRRIGRNELDTIQVCMAIADAQMEYALSDPDGDGLQEYARKFISDPGKRNGLYWQTEPGEAPSPLGPLVADASAGKRDRAGSPPVRSAFRQSFAARIL